MRGLLAREPAAFYAHGKVFPSASPGEDRTAGEGGGILL